MDFSISLPYKSINKVLKQQYGCKVYKIALSTGCSCPHRVPYGNSSLQSGDKHVKADFWGKGCFFCGEEGAGEFAAHKDLSISDQIKWGKQQLRNKLKLDQTGKRLNGESVKFIAYFQSFTNTYGSVSLLKPKFLEALADKDVIALSIGTRVDCLPPDILEMLEALVKIKPVWIELGLQSFHQKTHDALNTQLKVEDFATGIENLSQRNIQIIAHLILGLPGESQSDVLETVEKISALPIQGVKFSLLHILQNTALAELYQKGEVNVLDLKAYLELVSKALAYLHPDIAVHRLTGDGAKHLLIAPRWTSNKRMVLNEIHQYLKQNNIVQGQYCGLKLGGQRIVEKKGS